MRDATPAAMSAAGTIDIRQALGLRAIINVSGPMSAACHSLHTP